MSDQQSHSSSEDLATQIVELEHKLAFQQRAFEDLNSVVLEQQVAVEELRRETASLKQMLQGLADGGLGEDLPHEKPPHY